MNHIHYKEEVLNEYIPGHSGVKDMRLTVIEKVFVKTKHMRLVREEKFIKEFQTDYKGLNKR